MRRWILVCAMFLLASCDAGSNEGGADEADGGSDAEVSADTIGRTDVRPDSSGDTETEMQQASELSDQALCEQECSLPNSTDPECPSSGVRGWCIDWCVAAVEGHSGACRECIAGRGDSGWGGCSEFECVCYIYPSDREIEDYPTACEDVCGE